MRPSGSTAMTAAAIPGKGDVLTAPPLGRDAQLQELRLESWPDFVIVTIEMLPVSAAAAATAAAARSGCCSSNFEGTTAQQQLNVANLRDATSISHCYNNKNLPVQHHSSTPNAILRGARSRDRPIPCPIYCVNEVHCTARHPPTSFTLPVGEHPSVRIDIELLRGVVGLRTGLLRLRARRAEESARSYQITKEYIA
eukprot:gene3525-biopygen123